MVRRGYAKHFRAVSKIRFLGDTDHAGVFFIHLFPSQNGPKLN